MSESTDPGSGVVYTETVVWAAPEAHVKDAPYQLAIVTLEHGSRLTGRIVGERVSIGDRVEFVDHRKAVAYFRKAPRNGD